MEGRDDGCTKSLGLMTWLELVGKVDSHGRILKMILEFRSLSKGFKE